MTGRPPIGLGVGPGVLRRGPSLRNWLGGGSWPGVSVQDRGRLGWGVGLGVGLGLGLSFCQGLFLGLLLGSGLGVRFWLGLGMRLDFGLRVWLGQGLWLDLGFGLELGLWFGLVGRRVDLLLTLGAWSRHVHS